MVLPADDLDDSPTVSNFSSSPCLVQLLCQAVFFLSFCVVVMNVEEWRTGGAVVSWTRDDETENENQISGIKYQISNNPPFKGRELLLHDK